MNRTTPSASAAQRHSSASVRTSLLASLLLLAFVACGGGGSTGDGEEAAASAERRFLSVGTAPPGGTFYVIGGALAEVLNEHGAEGWRATAEATKGTQENIRRLARGELDLALANSAISYFGVRGEEGWEEAYPIRAVMTLAPNVALFVTEEGSGVRSLADLAGRRVVVGPAGAGFEYFLRPILGAHGVTYDDFSPLFNTQSGAVDMLTDGSADAAFLGGGVPTPSITQAAAGSDVFFIPFDDEAKAELVGDFPFFQLATIPAGTYRGQEADYEGLDVGSMHLIAAADADEETIYQVAKTLWEQRAAVAERHAAGRAIRESVVVRDTGVPFHPGALRFYREAGLLSDSPEPAGDDAAAADASGAS